jgi:two-component system NtrC family sensor kinase
VPLTRQLRPILRVGLPVALAAGLVSVAILNVVLVKTTIDAEVSPEGLYYSLALVGIVALAVAASVRLRRPNDPATLHFFWLVVSFFSVVAFTPTRHAGRLDAFFDWANAVGRLTLPPLFLHFALVFPDRAHPWARSRSGRLTVSLFYLPGVVVGLWRVAIALQGLRRPEAAVLLTRIDAFDGVYLSLCLLGGLALMLRALSRLRSVTARRQLRWIVWGSTLGALPFGGLYVMPLLLGRRVPYVEYSAVLLGCIPLAFASALVRYRLMDIEVIIKKALAVAANVLLLGLIYWVTRQLISLIAAPDQEFWALFATLVVALVAPQMWNAVRGGLDRLHYRDRYDYRRALVAFARELNSDLDLDRLSLRLVTRVHETLAVDRIALYVPPAGGPGDRLVPVASAGFTERPAPVLMRSSVLGARLISGQTLVVDDPLPHRRLAGDDAADWRAAGLFVFVPCVSSNTTIAALAIGRKAESEPISSEDMALVGAVAAQAATALENARLYGQLQATADEIDQLRQFSDSVVESLTDVLVVVDLDDRVLRCNRRVEALVGRSREAAVGRALSTIFSASFVDALQASRRESPQGATLYRVPIAKGDGASTRALLVNVGIAPFQTADGRQAGWIFVIEDITDRANLEEQLRLSEKMAAIGLLAAGVAHEVNTPLTGISSFTQLLLDRADPGDPRTQLLEKIERQTFRAAKIVNSLLNLARPTGAEAGPAPVDVNGVIGDVLSLLEHQFRMSRIQVRRELASPGVVVSGVEYKLQQVFLNLFLNGRDAMPKGGWLSVMTSVAGGQAVIEVSDTGVGIPAEHLARIYDPFFTTKPDGRGTGLGLSVTYGIVQEHAGTLTCTSDLGHGTRFRMTLPLADRSTVEAV